MRRGIDFLEDLANVIFFLAVEDTMPEELERFEGRRWINTCAIGLDKGKWEDEGLFRPQSHPRDVTELDAEIRSIYTFVGSGTTRRSLPAWGGCADQ